MSNIKQDDVTNALKDLVSMGGVFDVNEMGYVITKSKGDVVKVQTKGDPKPLIVYRSVITDPTAQILNPFPEGAGATADQKWFYQTMFAQFAWRVVDALNFIVERVVALDGKKPTKADLPIATAKFISPFMKMADEKMLKELDTISNPYEKFISVVYTGPKKTAKFSASIFDAPGFRDQFDVRKKTWNFLEAAFIALFNLDKKADFSEILFDYQVKTDSVGYPKLDATLRLYSMLYTRLMPVLEMMDEFGDASGASDGMNGLRYTIDVAMLNKHISLLDEYFRLAKNIVQPSNAPATNIQQPQQSQHTSGMPTGQVIQQPGMPMSYQHSSAMNTPNGMPLSSGQMHGNVPPVGMAPSGMPPVGYAGAPNQMQQADNGMPTVYQRNEMVIQGAYSHPQGYAYAVPAIAGYGHAAGPVYNPPTMPIGGIPGAALHAPGQPSVQGYHQPSLNNAAPLL